ncbi:MAG TPA: hypothetical protein VFQ77_14935 [Pseudonocardiaceae bacterium]|jgi:hypothetical protein|nr:hypothetical protein [Pseudonocardiaceae bacterium]
MEVVELAGDPGPVAVCVDCGLGLELWYSPGVPVPGAIETVRPVIARAS